MKTWHQRITSHQALFLPSLTLLACFMETPPLRIMGQSVLPFIRTTFSWPLIAIELECPWRELNWWWSQQKLNLCTWKNHKSQNPLTQVLTMKAKVHKCVIDLNSSSKWTERQCNQVFVWMQSKWFGHDSMWLLLFMATHSVCWLLQ